MQNKLFSLIVCLLGIKIIWEVQSIFLLLAALCAIFGTLERLKR